MTTMTEKQYDPTASPCPACNGLNRHLHRRIAATNLSQFAVNMPCPLDDREGDA